MPPPREALAGHLARLAGRSGPGATPPVLWRLSELADEAWAMEVGCSWPRLARALSEEMGGQWIASGTGVTWVCGRQVYWLVGWGQVAGVRAARATAASLGCPVRSWTLGGVARALLAWTGVRQRCLECTREALSGVRWAYCAANPGVYSGATLCDMRGAYHEVVQRLPSPKLDWVGGRPIWEPLVGQEAERWAALVGAAGRSKPLRTRLLGCMIGGGRSCVTYHRGRLITRVSPAGPLVAAGLLVARTIYELCGLQAREGDAVYANTDCTIERGGPRRAVWERYGYPYTAQAEGSAEVRSLGCYRVGQRQTRWFGAGSRLEVAYPADPLPVTLTLSSWQ